MKNITKHIFLNAVACPTLGWLLRNEKIDTKARLTFSDKFRMEQGLDIGKKARTLFSNGVLVDDWNVDSAAEKTAELMNNPKVSAIFEATFLNGPFVAKADVLKRTEHSWRIFEVKSGVNDKPEHVDDMAYTYMVASRCNVPVSGISLMLLSKDYRLGLENDALFKEVEHTDDVQAKAALFEGVRQQIAEKTSSETQPTPSLRFECKDCDIFDECVGKGVKNHIFEIPRLSQSKFDSLTEEGILCIENIPDDFDLTANQSLVHQCVKSSKEYVSKDLKNQLAIIRFPAYYLDFETVMTAILCIQK
jgi:predicted RecB family nuclease